MIAILIKLHAYTRIYARCVMLKKQKINIWENLGEQNTKGKLFLSAFI